MVEPYNYIRFRWRGEDDLEKIAEDIGPSFKVKMFSQSRSRDYDMSLFKEQRDELKVSADTLSALLSRSRAVLYQQKVAPFTAKDLELRKKIFELYPRNSATPFPWMFTKETKFEIAK